MNEIITANEIPNDLSVAREPALILREAQRAAACLKDVISRKERPVIFNGKQYLQFEDWQTIGKFYGLLCSTADPREVTIGGVLGAEARAEVVDVRTGKIVGHASAWCLKDEPNWKAKPWYQLGSQAQTRAGAKALRNLLSWVVVLAGYGTTPAEEMEHEADRQAEAGPVNSLEERKWSPLAQQSGSVRYISQPQVKRFYAIAKSSGATDDDIKNYLTAEIGSDHTKMIPVDRYEELCAHFQPQ